MELWLWHIIGWGSGILLDLIIGDPHGIPHPVVAVGKLIAFLDGRLNNTDTDASGRKERKIICRGILLCIIILTVSVLITAALLTAAWLFRSAAFAVVEAVLTCYLLAARSLFEESGKVQKALDRGDLHAARRDLSMIVGRDTAHLEQAGIVRAAVETVAENTSDGVIAPLLYMAVGGPVLGILYKAVNTMDSMVGYNNDRYRFFGRPAARLDDLLNYLPSRISALMMILSAALLGIGNGRYSAAGAWRIWRRDRRKHKSPNSAQTESVCAGALQIRLGGPSRYHGVLVDKPWLGDDIRCIEKEDIGRSGLLMFVTEGVTALLLTGSMLAIYALVP